MSYRIKNICYADDDPDDHFIFSTAINEKFPDISLFNFNTYADLIDYLKDENQPLPDIIFLDQNMPGNDGNQCLQTLKKTARLLHVPIVIYSTGGNPVMIEKALASGAYKYAIKPDSMEEVKNNIERLLLEYEKTRS